MICAHKAFNTTYKLHAAAVQTEYCSTRWAQSCSYWQSDVHQQSSFHWVVVTHLRCRAFLDWGWVFKIHQVVTAIHCNWSAAIFTCRGSPFCEKKIKEMKSCRYNGICKSCSLEIALRFLFPWHHQSKFSDISVCKWSHACPDCNIEGSNFLIATCGAMNVLSKGMQLCISYSLIKDMHLGCKEENQFSECNVQIRTCK